MTNVNSKNIMTLTSKSLWSFTLAGWCLVQDLQGQERKQSDFCWRIMKRLHHGQFMKEIHAITLLKPTHCGCWDGHIWHQQEPSRTLAKERKNYSVFLAFNTDFKSAVKITTFERFNLCSSVWGRREVTTKDKTRWRHRGITWKKRGGDNSRVTDCRQFVCRVEVKPLKIQKHTWEHEAEFLHHFNVIQPHIWNNDKHRVLVLLLQLPELRRGLHRRGWRAAKEVYIAVVCPGNEGKFAKWWRANSLNG